jgi:hypothetical protein
MLYRYGTRDTFARYVSVGLFDFSAIFSYQKEKLLQIKSCKEITVKRTGTEKCRKRSAAFVGCRFRNINVSYIYKFIRKRIIFIFTRNVLLLQIQF